MPDAAAKGNFSRADDLCGGPQFPIASVGNFEATAGGWGVIFEDSPDTAIQYDVPGGVEEEVRTEGVVLPIQGTQNVWGSVELLILNHYRANRMTKVKQEHWHPGAEQSYLESAVVSCGGGGLPSLTIHKPTGCITTAPI